MCEYGRTVVSRSCLRLILACVAAAVFAQQPKGGLPRREAYVRATALAELGRKMFFDTSLSASGTMSCASCHDPAFAYAPANALAVQAGGDRLNQWGMRAVPSLRYLQVIPQFTEHYFDTESTGDDSIDSGPTGGLTWDGRVDRGRDQARFPLLSSYEMGNKSAADVVAAAMKSSYAAELRRLSGDRVDVTGTFNTMLEAFEAWEQDAAEFYPYSSKYDAWLAGKAILSEREQHGLNLFTDRDKGDCARCHIATQGTRGTPPQFTDYGLIALGAPRNSRIPANTNPDWYDLGLCGPVRTDLADKADYCGRFRTPTLRNVATRQSFFHNGAFHTLKEVIEFYVERDTRPEKWYPRDGAGQVLKFNDIPAAFRSNVESGTPFGRPAGSAPSLNEEEIRDVVAFLETLTDGFQSPSK